MCNVNFENRVSPCYAASFSPTRINFGFIVENIFDVNENDLSVTIEASISMRWTDPRIKLKAASANISLMAREQRLIDISTRY